MVNVLRKLAKSNIRLSPPQTLASGFLIMILIGTVLLKLPISTIEPMRLLDALFMATSATTVTGLAVIDQGTGFTTFGYVVLMLLMQVGGLGFMTFAVMIVLVLGKRVGLKERILVQEALNQTSVGGVVRLVKVLFIFSISVELLAVLFLSIKWVPEYGWTDGIFYSLFHAVSAFNNGGLSTWSDSLMQYVGSPVVNITISSLFILGGIGFTVIADLYYRRSFRKLSLHSKLMIVGTFVLNFVAMLILFTIEYSNPATLGALSFIEKWWASYFQAVVPRTAGFNSISIGSMDEGSILLILFLMFVGAGSGSTASGIKLTTFLVIIFTVKSFLRGRKEVTIQKRTIKNDIILRALAITVTSAFIVFLSIFSLTLTEDAPFIWIVFEAFSAFGTVGLSMGLTAELSDVGKQIIIILMFIGRLGPLTLAFSLAKANPTKIRYPEGDVFTG
ncbi:TrkH family potassium uptake protein [Bacillus fonticola]|uniref:TrkH family potassium uptake protein n=1 Tax=Bacillus fonticola TaxID=2728853 RepID=UPI001472EAE8|nr:TrkH family potassium uptake protein [Bacillus fonticola]